MKDVWTNQSAQWERVGPPLRPGPEDQACLEEIVRTWGAAPEALELGVTPEIATMKWPAGGELIAVDKSMDMIRRVWPFKQDRVICADWLAFPLPSGSRDIVASDGPFGVLRYHQYEAFIREVLRVLRPVGLFAFRVFIRPEGREEPRDVFRELMAGRIGSFHAFKLRLLMAVQRDTASGVKTGEVWDCWSVEGPKPEAVASKCGWPIEQIATIDAYRGQSTVYTFPMLSELLRCFPRIMKSRCIPKTYELGERCPTFLLIAPSSA